MILLDYLYIQHPLTVRDPSFPVIDLPDQTPLSSSLIVLSLLWCLERSSRTIVERFSQLAPLAAFLVMNSFGLSEPLISFVRLFRVLDWYLWSTLFLSSSISSIWLMRGLGSDFKQNVLSWTLSENSSSGFKISFLIFLINFSCLLILLSFSTISTVSLFCSSLSASLSLVSSWAKCTRLVLWLSRT